MHERAEALKGTKSLEQISTIKLRQELATVKTKLATLESDYEAFKTKVIAILRKQSVQNSRARSDRNSTITASDVEQLIRKNLK